MRISHGGCHMQRRWLENAYVGLRGESYVREVHRGDIDGLVRNLSMWLV